MHFSSKLSHLAKIQLLLIAAGGILLTDLHNWVILYASK